MSDKDIETRQSELTKEADELVKQRTVHSQKISEINSRIEQLKGAYAELERQKTETDTPKKESPTEDKVKK